MHVMHGKMLSKQFNHLFVHGSAAQASCAVQPCSTAWLTG